MEVRTDTLPGLFEMLKYKQAWKMKANANKSRVPYSNRAGASFGLVLHLSSFLSPMEKEMADSTLRKRIVGMNRHSNRHTSANGSARCVQNFDDSLSSAIRMTYRISLRSSSLWEPRHPLLKVFIRYFIVLFGSCEFRRVINS